MFASKDLKWLFNWYRDLYKNTKNEAEIKIDTIGNPGWGVGINISGLSLEKKITPITYKRFGLAFL